MITENPSKMPLFKNLTQAILKHSDKNAFCIKDIYYTYRDLAEKISGIRKSLNALDTPEKNIGLVTNDDPETYAAIIAIWLEGRSYVPVNPQMPVERNENMIRQAGIRTLFDSSEVPLFPGYGVINGLTTTTPVINLTPAEVPGEELAFIIFTSGSTGTPKGVPITRTNIASFMHSLSLLIPGIDEKDRVLQMFELTFDLSLVSWLVALLNGACLYTIPKDQIKYQFVFKLLDEYRITFAIMVPSILQYFAPYFDEIKCPDLKYSLFCGEPLLLDLTRAWSRCAPNATIMNVYGPTESTAFCTHYSFDRHSPNKAHNGILSIGKAMEHTDILIVDQENAPVQQGTTGELCLAGELTPGYLDNEVKNSNSFFHTEFKGTLRRFYKTGDLCFMDPDGDLLFIGRMDSQVKIQGHRVELLEIEFHAREYLGKTNAVALAFPEEMGSKNLRVGLFIEGEAFDTTPLLAYMKTKLPSYMIPARIRFESTFLYNSNGKIDRNKLSHKFQQQ